VSERDSVGLVHRGGIPPAPSGGSPPVPSVGTAMRRGWAAVRSPLMVLATPPPGPAGETAAGAGPRRWTSYRRPSASCLTPGPKVVPMPSRPLCGPVRSASGPGAPSGVNVGEAERFVEALAPGGSAGPGLLANTAEIGGVTGVTKPARPRLTIGPAPTDGMPGGVAALREFVESGEEVGTKVGAAALEIAGSVGRAKIGAARRASTGAAGHATIGTGVLRGAGVVARAPISTVVPGLAGALAMTKALAMTGALVMTGAA
jgi:hypothetical protein